MAAVNIDDPDLNEAERDVIISGLMKEEAKVTCNALVKGWLSRVKCLIMRTEILLASLCK